jgi:hypothetical protein
MAKRFGGEHSPQSADNPATKSTTAAQHDPRFWILAAASLPLLVTAFGNSATGMLIDLCAFAAFAAAFWLLQRGTIAKQSYDAQAVATRPAIPRLIIGADICGLGVFLAAFEAGFVNAMIYGVVAAILCVISFGIDPLKNKGMEGFDEFSNQRVARVVDQAKELLDAMNKAVKATNNQKVIDQTSRFTKTANDVCLAVQSDPRDLSQVRKYLTVYLTGARDSARKFAQLSSASENLSTQAKFMALLEDLEVSFRGKLDVIKSNDIEDLDVEIDVLRDRLKRDGFNQ